MAKELLNTADADLEANCRKLKSRCRGELEYVASEGKFDMQNPVLFGIVSTMAELLKGDTQLVESINSIIRLVGQRCPNAVSKDRCQKGGEGGACRSRCSGQAMVQCVEVCQTLVVGPNCSRHHMPVRLERGGSLCSAYSHQHGLLG